MNMFRLVLAAVFVFAGVFSFAQEAEEPVASNTVVESGASSDAAQPE